MRQLVLCSFLATATVAPTLAFAEGESRPSAKASQPTEAPVAEAKPVTATEAQNGPHKAQGSGLLESGDALLGIHQPRK